jgi:hypothetical protein
MKRTVVASILAVILILVVVTFAQTQHPTYPPSPKGNTERFDLCAARIEMLVKDERQTRSVEQPIVIRIDKMTGQTWRLSCQGDISKDKSEFSYFWIPMEF